MTQNTLATIRGTYNQFASMIHRMSLDGDTEYSDLYLNVIDNEIQILQAAQGGVVLSYGTFTDDYFDEITVDASTTVFETTDSQGDDISIDVGCQAIVNVDDVLTYLDFADDGSGGRIEVQLTGEDDGLASHIRATGPSLNTWTALPGSQSALEQVPHYLADRFDDENRYTNPKGDPAPTQVEMKAEYLHQIVELVQEDDRAEFYPFVIEDDDLRIDVGDESASGARGTLPTMVIDGPDVDNTYYDGFEEVLNVMDGTVSMQTAPDNNPLSIVDDEDDYAIRHVVGSVSAE